MQSFGKFAEITVARSEHSLDSHFPYNVFKIFCNITRRSRYVFSQGYRSILCLDEWNLKNNRNCFISSNVCPNQESFLLCFQNCSFAIKTESPPEGFGLKNKRNKKSLHSEQIPNVKRNENNHQQSNKSFQVFFPWIDFVEIVQLITAIDVKNPKNHQGEQCRWFSNLTEKTIDSVIKLPVSKASTMVQRKALVSLSSHCSEVCKGFVRSICQIQSFASLAWSLNQHIQ